MGRLLWSGYADVGYCGRLLWSEYNAVVELLGCRGVDRLSWSRYAVVGWVGCCGVGMRLWNG